MAASVVITAAATLIVSRQRMLRVISGLEHVSDAAHHANEVGLTSGV